MQLLQQLSVSKERIYIGGLDPPRLSGNDILRRLKSLNQIEVESSVICNRKDTDDNKPFFHITAVSKHDSDSALSIIAKQYHNVKWKGCKLVVEAAKPHFLDRLEEERRKKATEARVKPTINIDRTRKLYIGGAQKRSDSGYDKQIYFSNTLVGQVPLGNRKDIRDAVEAAANEKKWKGMSAHGRAQVLYYAAENLELRKQEFAQTILLVGRLYTLEFI